MTIDPLTMVVVDILGKYVIDKGVSLLKDTGQSAFQAAAKLFEQVMAGLKADPAEARNTERFKQNPEGYRAPMAEAITEKVKNDPDFAAQLAALLEDYKKAIITVETSNVNADVIAMQGSAAAGEGGVAVIGNVQGGISLRNTQSNRSSEGDDP